MELFVNVLLALQLRIFNKYTTVFLNSINVFPTCEIFYYFRFTLFVYSEISMRGLFVFICCNLFCIVTLFAQESNEAKLPVMLSIPAKASLSISGPLPSFSLKQDATYKQVISPTSSGKTWINYSSVVEDGSTNSIYASLNPGNIPAEISIQLTPGRYSGTGRGQFGIPTAPIFLSTYPQAFITDIGTCYTGTGMNNGHTLSFSWLLDPESDSDFVPLEGLQIVAEIIYTIKTD